MSERTVAVVQARMGSTRLPGKVLEPVGDRSLLALVLARVGHAEAVDEVVLATSALPADDPVAAAGAAAGVRVVRGSEHDVLARYADAAAVTGAGVVVRVTADCPLVDPALIDAVVALRTREDLDYAAVLTGAVHAAPGRRRFPDGLDAEAVTAAALSAAAAEARAPGEREHVMPFITARPERFRLGWLQADEDRGDERWTVDHPDDLELVRAVVAALGGDDRFGAGDVLAVLDADPRLRTLNAHRRAAG